MRVNYVITYLIKINKSKLMVRKCFVLREEVMDIFHGKYYIHTIENCHFILLMSVFLVQWNVGRIEVIVSALMHQKQYKVKHYYAEKSADQLV